MQVTSPHLSDIILSKTLSEMLHTSNTNGGESLAEFVRDDLDTGEVLDSLVDRGGGGVGAGLESPLDLEGFGILTFLLHHSSVQTSA